MSEKQNPQTLFDVEELLTSNHRDRSSQHLTPGTRRMMTLMLETGLSKEVIAALLKVADVNPALIQYFAGPVIVHQSPWAETTPPWIIDAVYVDRLEALFAEHDAGIVGKIVTPSEILAVMMPATMEAPMRLDWAELYQWAGNETLTRHKRLKDGKTFWELTGIKAIPFNRVKDNYESLGRDVRSIVVEVAKSRGWGKKDRYKLLDDPMVDQDLSEDDSPSVVQLELGEVDLGEPSESVTPPSPTTKAPDIVQFSLF